MTRLLLRSGLVLLAALVLSPLASAQSTLWINEFHYDNAGTDVNEFVEVAVRSGATFNAADYSVVLYNGSGGVTYDTKALTAFTASAPVAIAGSAETITFYTYVYPSNGIQNGPPDGLALANTTTPEVVQFLSYEGTFAATNGPANGMTSTDVGVFEDGLANDTSIGYAGTGDTTDDFTYGLATAQTPGAVNQGQTFDAGGGPAAETASVTFAPTSATVTEGGTATTSVVLTITNEQGGDGLDTAVSGTITVGAAYTADVTSYTGTFTFPAGSADGASVPVTIVTADDADFEGTETVPFSFGTVTGGTGSGTFALTITDNDAPPSTPPVVINEIDSDTPGTDTAEFIELLGPPNASLSGLVLVLFNGSNNTSYLAVDLTGQTTDANGLFVVCDQAANVAGCGLDVPGTAGTGFIQNGEDAAALYVGSAGSFPNGTAPTVVNLVDAVVYGTGDPLASGLLSGLGLPPTYQFEENYGGAQATQSLARLTVTAGGMMGPSALFYVATPSPGALNDATVTVDRTADVADVAGWRLLGSPVLESLDPTTPVQVGDLAAINLVQGIAAGTDNGPQYPAAPGPNILTAYNGNGTSAGFTPPASTDTALPPGQGFFWYFYDQDITPDANGPYGPGTSVSYDLASPAFTLSLTGTPVDDGFSTAGQTAPVSPDGLYMAANPFAYPFALSGVSVTDATLQDNFSIYDPTSGSYTTLTSTDVVAPWQGVFAEATSPTGATITVNTTSDAVVPTSGVALLARPATAEARLSLRLDGALTSGATVADYAATVRLLDDATAGWDRYDGSKLLPPQADQALVAFVGDRGGAATRQAVSSLPLSLTEAVTLPVVLRASGAGSFTLTWGASTLPDGWTATLRDLVSGTVVDLGTATSYPFTSDATDWTTRFEMVLAPRGAVATEAGLSALSLGMPYPNPATSQATLALRTDAAQRVTATVVDALGRTVATVFDGALAAGAEQMLVVSTAGLAPGLYVVRVTGETFAQSRRLVVAR